jgi:hypothetical protein
MTRSKFMDILESEEISFYEQENRIIVDEPSIFDLEITSIPSGVIFRNGGDVYLDLVTNLPKDTEFENYGSVFIQSVVSFSKGIKFRNRGDVNIESLRVIDKEIIFKNSRDIKFDLLGKITKGIIFQNKGSIVFGSDDFPSFCEGVRFENGEDIKIFNSSIEKMFINGIRKQRILNCMIIQLYS